MDARRRAGLTMAGAARIILIMAGGTGGHVMPALAVADYMRAAGWRVVWLGAKDGMEATLVPKHGYEMEWIRFSGLRGKGIVRVALLPLTTIATLASGTSTPSFSTRPVTSLE